MIGHDIAREYEAGNIRGWADHLVDPVKQLLTPEDFKLAGQTRSTAGRKLFLFTAYRKAFGKDFPLTGPDEKQLIGDCTSWGAKHAVEIITATSIIMGHNRAIAKNIFSPYIYGCTRVLVEHQHSHQDGATGAGTAEAVKKYGAVPTDGDGVPVYSGQIAKQYGYSGPPKDMIQFGEQHLVQNYAQIRSWDDLVTAIMNGYACPTASNIGYEMEARDDGFHHRKGSWGHQMCFIGVDETYTEPYALIWNNWGDCHGHLKDFQTGDPFPQGMILRVRRKDAESHINAEETYAYSQYQTFPEQLLPDDLFKIA